MKDNTRPWYFWPVIAFLVGLLVGWLVIGWLVWPVTWTNAQLRDLRPDLRNEYVAMVAESYAQTRNIEQARARLAGWSEVDLAKDLSAAQEVFVARNLQTAQNVQDLAVALGVTTAAGAPVTGDQQPPQAQATAPPAAAGAASGVSTLRQVCTAGIFILLAAGALALLVFLFRRWRATSETNGVPAQPAYDELDTIAAADQAQARWPAQETVVEEVPSSRGGYSNPPVRPYIADDDDAAGQDAVQPIPLRPVGQAPVDPSRTDASAGRPPVPPPPAAAAAAAAAANGNLKRLVENTAVYQMGEPDYDEAFDITDPADGFMGQFGLQLIEPFGRERDQAVALQVWLWDSSDPDTQAKVLMSEGAYRDTALRSQHAGEHQAVSVRPGAEFDLTSHDLLLKGRVEKASYAEADPPRTIFADLHVKLTVYRRV